MMTLSHSLEAVGCFVCFELRALYFVEAGLRLSVLLTQPSE